MNTKYKITVTILILIIFFAIIALSLIYKDNVNLESSTPTSTASHDTVLYEDDYITIISTQFIRRNNNEYEIEYLVENKTEALINVYCDVAVVDGFTVDELILYENIEPNSKIIGMNTLSINNVPSITCSNHDVILNITVHNEDFILDYYEATVNLTVTIE